MINAAAQPLRTQSNIMNQGCECMPVIGDERELEPLFAVLATMSIAKSYPRDLEALLQSNGTPNVSNGMKETISRITTILRYSRDDFELLSMDGTLKHHLNYFDLDDTHPRATKSKDDRNLRLGTKCYRTLIAMYYEPNRRFFNELLRGFEILRDVIQDESKKSTLMPEFNVVVTKVATCELENPDPNFKKNDLDEVVEMLKKKK